MHQHKASPPYPQRSCGIVMQAISPGVQHALIAGLHMSNPRADAPGVQHCVCLWCFICMPQCHCLHRQTWFFPHLSPMLAWQAPALHATKTAASSAAATRDRLRGRRTPHLRGAGIRAAGGAESLLTAAAFACCLPLPAKRLCQLRRCLNRKPCRCLTSFRRQRP